MRSVKSFIAAGAATLLSQAAFAADMAIAPPPYAPPVVEDFGGWYLRGDIGFSNQRVDRLNNVLDRHNYVVGSEQQLQHRGHLRPRRRLPGSTTGSAPTSPVQYRGNSQFYGTDRHHAMRASHRRRHLPRQQERVGRSRQRLCRSRHLVVRHPVHRRRRRRRAGRDQRLHRPGHCQQWRRCARPGAGIALRRQRVEVEFRLGCACRSRLQGHAELHRRTRL